MNRILNLILTLCVVVLFSSCQNEQEYKEPINEGIVLNLSSGLTRASATAGESFVSHIDVFIYNDENGYPSERVYYDRYDVNNSESVTLNAKRSSFTKNAKYHVYILANSTLLEEDFEPMLSFHELQNQKQEDTNIHITGLALDNAPKYFLMDAIATDTSGDNSVILYNGNDVEDTLLEATLRRAAAKVVINITATENIEFKPFGIADGSEGGLYYIRNLPIDAYLLAEARNDELVEATVRNTTKANNEYFAWNPETDSKSVSLVTYVYPNTWSNSSSLEHETCAIMNLPQTYTSDDGVAIDYVNSWYKIPMSGESMFRRNNYYEININLSRPGAILESTPIDIEDVYYEVDEWVSQQINVGDEETPAYLMVNREELEMRNVDVDETSLEFSSSSPVTVSVKMVTVNGIQVPDIYYYNKHSIKVYTNPTITGTTDGGIQGNIKVTSPQPENNTIRYFTLVITNEEGISKEVLVKQYPLVYITNVLGLYSYRSDFIWLDEANGILNGDGMAVTDHFQNRGARVPYSVGYVDGKEKFYLDDSGFFVSKVTYAIYNENAGDKQGLAQVYYYTQNEYDLFADEYNARMYHIRITETSDEYVLGKPKITDGITDPGEDNARMVSPSFMIASRLGTIVVSRIDASSEEDYLTVYAEHAKQYVEVYRDPETGELIHLNDWRLPTAAELKIIYQYQGANGVSADAMDYLLNAGAYFSASGPVANPSSELEGISVRCVRDAY